MSLLSSKFLKGAILGGGKRLLYRMDENRGIGQKGLETLEQANKEVNEEVANFKNIYETALQVGGNVGGGTFANYIFATEDIEYIAGLQSLAPEARNEAFSTLKKNFESLDDETKNSYEDYTQVAQNKFVADVNQSKINKGLVSKNNMGQDTQNFLAKLMFEPPTNITERQEELVDIKLPDLVYPSVTTGGFDAISTAPKEIDVTEANILSYLKSSIEAFGLTFDQDKTVAELDLQNEIKNDYTTLINPATPIEDRIKLLEKYQNRIQIMKTPIADLKTTSTSNQNTGTIDSTGAGQDNTEFVLSADLLEDDTPPYTGETI